MFFRDWDDFFFFFGVLYYESRISLFGDGDLQKRGLGV